MASGVLISDIYTYKNVWIAPYSQLEELQKIGKIYAGQGPALMTEFSIYGARYFLRDMGAEAVSELRQHLIPKRDGNEVPRGMAADIDSFSPQTLEYFNILVLRKSPNASRPPMNYSLSWSGLHYEVWKKISVNYSVVDTLPLGGYFQPGANPSCNSVDNFLAQRRKGDMVYSAKRDQISIVDFSKGDLPADWHPAIPYSGGVNFAGTGGFSRMFTVNETQFYDFSMAGSYPGLLKIQVDGLQVFSGNSIVEENSSLTNPLTHIRLSAGSHLLTLNYETPRFMPGSDVNSSFGPIFISSQSAEAVKVRQISNSRVGELCKENLDWIAIARKQ